MTPLTTKELMMQNQEFWQIPFMNFVDEFRKKKSTDMLSQSIVPDNEKFDALLASTIEFLCNEVHVTLPAWVDNIPACRDPWFVAGVDNCKAIAIVESPIWFRRRKIFVFENFLDRV